MATAGEYRTQEARRSDNIARVRFAMESLYRTYIVDSDKAELRGAAIRALDEFLVGLGAESYTSELERRY